MVSCRYIKHDHHRLEEWVFAIHSVDRCPRLLLHAGDSCYYGRECGEGKYSKLIHEKNIYNPFLTLLADVLGRCRYVLHAAHHCSWLLLLRSYATCCHFPLVSAAQIQQSRRVIHSPPLPFDQCFLLPVGFSLPLSASHSASISFSLSLSPEKDLLKLKQAKADMGYLYCFESIHHQDSAELFVNGK